MYRGGLSMRITKRMTVALNKKGELVDIENFEAGEEVFCPACHGKLIAKKGEVVMHHFAHEKGASCSSGYETSIIVASEQIIKEKGIWMPARILKKQNDRGEITICEEGLYQVKNVRQENNVCSDIPNLRFDLDGEKWILVCDAGREYKEEEFKDLTANFSILILDFTMYEEIVGFKTLESIITRKSPSKRIKNDILVKEYIKKFLTFCDFLPRNGTHPCPLRKEGSSVSYQTHCIKCPYNFSVMGVRLMDVPCGGVCRLSSRQSVDALVDATFDGGLLSTVTVRRDGRKVVKKVPPRDKVKNGLFEVREGVYRDNLTLLEIWNIVRYPFIARNGEEYVYVFEKPCEGAKIKKTLGRTERYWSLGDTEFDAEKRYDFVDFMRAKPPINIPFAIEK